VVTDERGRPVGYAMARVIDGGGHLDQLSVVPEHGGRGLGRRLIDHVDGWAADRGLPALTLSTFRDVPWNGPWYRRLGFAVVPEGELGPGLRAVRRRERRLGLDLSRRQFMRRPTGRQDGGSPGRGGGGDTGRGGDGGERDGGGEGATDH
jgi:hypothetical protein